MVAELAALAVVIFAAAAETLHYRRTRRVSRLAFGPTGRPRLWASGAPIARVAAFGALTWGLLTLALLPPKVHRSEQIDKSEMRHLLIVLDVSPSMRLKDAGPTREQSRMQRVADLMDSFLQRADAARFWITVVAVYNGAKPVVEKTTDMEVVRNIFGDLPMQYAFEAGETRLFDGLEEAAKIAHPWNPRSATLLLISDGDTVPAKGMPQMPASISHSLVVGVGDPKTGSFIDGRQSRQDASTLRQIGVRLGGLYHDGNEKQIPTDMLMTITGSGRKGMFERLTRREYALAATVLGALIFGLLPTLLHAAGTAWRPGVPVAANRPMRRKSRNEQTRPREGVSGRV